MTTMKKEFRQAVRNHILMECIRTDDLDTHKEDLEKAVEDFQNWYSPYEQKMNPNIGDAFVEYLRGLPSGFNAEFTYAGIHEKLKQWFTENDMEYNDEYAYTHKEVKTYYNLVLREFIALCRIYEVKF